MNHCLRPFRLGAAAILAAVLSAAAVVLAQQSAPPTTKSATLPSTASATRPADPTTQPSSSYRWRLIEDGAGGDATGMVFHPLDASFRYLQSAHTGGYRWDHDTQRWLSFTDLHPDPAFGHVAGLAIDPRDGSVLHFAAGRPRGEIFRSLEQGRTFEPANLLKPDGRQIYIDGGDASAGFQERLLADPNNPAVVYFASRFDGLWRSDRSGSADSWRQLESFPVRGDVANLNDERGRVIRQSAPAGGLSAVAIDPAGGTIQIDGLLLSRVIYVGVVGDRRLQRGGPGGLVDQLPEGGLWRSNDGGQSWSLLPGPLDRDNAATQVRVGMDGTLFATISGRVVRASATVGRVSNLAVLGAQDGFVAIAIDPADPKHVVIARRGPALLNDDVRLFRTVDGGGAWTPIKATFDLPRWMQPSSRGLTHFLAFEPNALREKNERTKVLWLGDNIGPWRCADLDAQRTDWKLISRGRGGLAVTSLATPPALRGAAIAPLLATARGIDGFRYHSFTAIPQRTLTAATDGREPLAGATSVAFCEADPRFVAVVGDGGGRLSTDNGRRWSPFDGHTKPLEGEVAGVNPRGGQIAIGATVQASGSPTMVWFPANAPPRSSVDWGKSWQLSGGELPPATPADPQEASAVPLAADTADGSTFYHYNDNAADTGFGVVSISTDAGVTWRAAGRIAYRGKRGRMPLRQLRAAPSRKGEIWLSLSDPFSTTDREPAQGLHRSIDGGRSWTKIADWERVSAFAFGAPAPGRQHPSVVAAGIYRGRTGIFLSDNAIDQGGGAWRQIWDKSDTESPAIARCLLHVAADRQNYGRIFAGGSSTDTTRMPATLSGRGVFYGEPIVNVVPAPVTNLVVVPEPVSVAGVARVVIEWTEPIDGAVYDVERAPADAPNQWQTVAGSAWYGLFIDAQVKPGRYVYRVTAANALGRSAPVMSEVVEVKAAAED